MAASASRSNQQLRYVLVHGLLLVAALVIGGDVVVAAAEPSSPPPSLMQTQQVLFEAPPPPGGWAAALTEQAAGGRRLLIGSRAPTCTYNECRGCRHRCSVQEGPIDASDPMNSAYHYKCVCHI